MVSRGLKVSSLKNEQPLVSSLNLNPQPFVRRKAKQQQWFTPWLEQQIESGDIDGLEWIDKEIGIFKVPWVRADNPEFELETHAELFKRWVSHTGKYRPGDQPDPSTWKVRFRCALRKTQEIVEIKHLGNLEGTRAYRVFKFEPKLKERRNYMGSSSESSISIETAVCGRKVKQLVPDYPHWRYPGMSEWDINQNMSEPRYLENWDMYFPEGVQNEFGYFEGPSFALTGAQDIMYSDAHGTCPLPSYLIQDGFNATMESVTADISTLSLEQNSVSSERNCSDSALLSKSSYGSFVPFETAQLKYVYNSNAK